MNRHAIRVGFHWLTALLVAAVFAIAFTHESIEDSESRLFWLDMHRAIGLLILAIAVIRLLFRFILRFERLHETNPFLRSVAAISHIFLYGGLLAMPLLGWAQSSAKMRHFKVFGVKLPALLKHDSDLGDRIGEWHETLGWAMLALIGLHAAAALYHHFVRKDGVLINMLRSRPLLP